MGDTIKSMNKLYFLGAYLTILVPVLKKKILLLPSTYNESVWTFSLSKQHTGAICLIFSYIKK